MAEDGWLGRFLQLFGPLVAAWSAFLAYLVHLKKIRNAEKTASHSRLLEEIDRLRSERDVVSEERDMVRDRWAECERVSAERLGRAVIAEARLVAKDQEHGRPSILPGISEQSGGGK